MTKDHFCGVVLKSTERDEAAPLTHLVRPSGNLEALRVGEDRRIVLGLQDTVFSPLAEVACSAGINVVDPWLVKELRQAKDHAHQIVGASSVIDLLHRRRDLVVGLS